MKIGVVSDTHGDRLAIKQTVETVGKVDMWMHAGDYSQDGRLLAELSGVPVVVVAGNCDGHTQAKGDEFITVEGRKIWLTHGHRYKVKHGIRDIAMWGLEYGVDIIIFGHTHEPELTWVQDLLIFNPGSAAHPHGKSPTCGILEISAETGRVDARIVELC